MDGCTEMDMKILSQLKEYPSHSKLYQVTKNFVDINFLSSLDRILLRKGDFSSDNLATSLRHSLSMRDLKVLDRVFYGNDVELMDISVVSFAIGWMAPNQHTSMIHKTLIFDVRIFNVPEHLTYDTINDTAMSLVTRRKIQNVFEKEMLIFPTFQANGFFLTVIKNPAGALRNSSGVVDGDCEVFHIGTGNIEKYKKTVVPMIMQLMIQLAVHFETGKKFMVHRVESKEYVTKEVGKYEKPHFMLSFLEDILSTEQDSLDLDAMADELVQLRQRERKTKFTTYRTKLATAVNNYVQELPKDDVAEYVLDLRTQVLQKYHKLQFSTAENDFITLD